MVRPAWLVLALAGACGTTTDTRPATLAEITETIFKPTCAAAECHSNFARKSGYAFDTVANARFSFLSDAKLIDYDNLQSDHATLLLNLTEEQVGAPRMPYDGPIPNADIDLIERWLAAGLTGICKPGAAGACIVQRSTGPNGVVTVTSQGVPCTEDGAFDQAFSPRTCSGGCNEGVCE